MANQEHLALLRQGVQAWNEWREQDMSKDPAQLIESFFSEKGMFTVPDLIGANLSGMDLCEVNLNFADLRGAILQGTEFRHAHLSHAKMKGADLRGASFIGADLGSADLTEANLDGASLHWAYLSEPKPHFFVSDLAPVWIHMGGTKLIRATLKGADLGYANFGWADLTGADFGGARMYYTQFTDNDLSSVRGLETVRHEGRSFIDIDTIYKSRGNIPEAFLRGAGVPENLIVFMHSLSAREYDYQSCFISYSSIDEKFVERLHADLQNNGVRCWFAPHDMRIGDEIRERIEKEIKEYDKLLLVLSENSIHSDWVESEVEAALEKERNKKHPVLFPLRLDDSALTTEKGWAANIRRTRHIGDMSGWQDDSRYKATLERLLRDLKPDSAPLLGQTSETVSMTPPSSRHSLEILHEKESLALCRELLGERVDKEQDMFRQLCKAADHVSLALNILLHRLNIDPKLDVKTLTKQMADLKEVMKQKSKSDDRNLNVRAAFDLSYATLSGSDKQLLRLLTLFEGPDFSAEMVGLVLDEDKDHALGLSRSVTNPNLSSNRTELFRIVNDTLSRLEQFALVEHTREGRYRLHPLLHAYARQALSEMGEEEQFGEFIADALLKYVNKLSKLGDWNDLEIDRENIFGVLNYCYTRQKDSIMLAMVESLRDFMIVRGYWEQAFLWLGRMGEVAERYGYKDTLASVLLSLGRLFLVRGKYSDAHDRLEKSRSLFRETGRQEGEAAVLNELGNIEFRQGNYSAARPHYEDALALQEKVSFKQGIAGTLHYLGTIEVVQSNFASAREYLKRALAIEEELENKPGISENLNVLGRIESAQGNKATAQQYHQRALALQKELGDQEGVAATLQPVGMTKLDLGNVDEAEKDFGEGLAIAQQIGSKRWIAIHQYSLGYLEAHYRLNRSRAIDYGLAALRSFEEIHAPEAEWARNLLRQLGIDW